MTTPSVDERRTNTREQIRAIALELFAEQGYEKTSLREIAERLGVTKAAVYYHYRTKEEILASLLDEHVAGMDAIIEWAEAQPAGLATRRELLRRYSELLAGPSGSEDVPHLIRFLQESQTSIKELNSGAEMRKRFERVAALLVDRDAPLADQLRSRLSLAALHFGAFAFDQLPGTRRERIDAALEVSLELCCRGE
ncbi:TetR/AcrR family transcriptional regulator [Pseudonocardia sp. GCM10023141]|uniref:TetR/AcrR family transcriptional regulator n=1 Tax=Pseudonocardia sp. GCM10023141 TaxID=3252653 RepID=UPI00361E520B